MHKLVSICIPTFNGKKNIAEPMQSALAQTYPKLEIIVSDDASTDNTLTIVERYRDKIEIPIHIHHHKPNRFRPIGTIQLLRPMGNIKKFFFKTIYSNILI